MQKRIRRFNPLIYIHDVRLKIAVFILAFFYVIGLFWYTLRTFRSDDPVPEISILNIDTRKKAEDLTTKVKCGLFIKNFPTFDFSSNNFVLDATVWFEFNKNQIMQSTINDFSFENGKIIHKSNPIINLNSDKIAVRYDVLAELKTNLNFHRFPLEDHTLSIVLKNNSASVYELYFEDDFDGISLTISPNLFTSNWKLHKYSKMAGFSNIQIDENNTKRTISMPRVLFVLDFQKVGLNKILIIFIPMFAALFFSFFTFLMSFNSYQGKTNLALTAATALLGYRFVIQQMSPAVGYFTVTDKIFILFLLLAVLILIFQIVLLRHYMFLMDREKIKQTEQTTLDRTYWVPKITEQINTYVYLTFVLIFLMVVSYVLLY